MISRTCVNLGEMCSYRIGGVADIVHFPEHIAEMQALVRLYACKNRPYWVHGRGQNTIFADAGTRLPVLATTRLNGLQRDGCVVRAQAGVLLDRLIVSTLEAGLAGLESLSGIPGSVGGAIHMNAGAYGTEISRHLLSVTVLSPSGKIETKVAADCNFSYRSCGNLQKDIILQAQWQFESGDKAKLLATRKDVLGRRAASQPLEFPSAGSVFKRPPGDYASRLIDAAGLKGTRIGGAQISDKHAGFIVNAGQASSRDVFELIACCQQRVKDVFDVDLELEQQICPVEAGKV